MGVTTLDFATRDELEGGEVPPPFLAGRRAYAQLDDKCQLQWHL